MEDRMETLGNIIGKDTEGRVRYTIHGHSPPRQNDSQTRSTQDTTGGKLLKHKPLLIPQEIPIQTMSRILKTSPPHESQDYQDWARHLDSYHRTGAQWDEYARKIPTPLRNLWGRIQSECRRNGFYGPVSRAVDKSEYRLIWYQVTDNNKKKPLPPKLIPTLCTYCERVCNRRDVNGIERPGSVPCWKR
jgi:hypothetical protein